MKESVFQSKLIMELKRTFEGSIVMKTDPCFIQGFPDILILYRRKWAALECKREIMAAVRPNQKYYIDKLNKMSFARFVYPENKKEVLNELREFFREG